MILDDNANQDDWLRILMILKDYIEDIIDDGVNGVADWCWCQMAIQKVLVLILLKILVMLIIGSTDLCGGLT